MSQGEILEAGFYLLGTTANLFHFVLKDPVFIIGTGRCGTSLLIKILGSHQQLVTFPGEANNLWHPKSYPYSKKVVETPPILEDPATFSRISVENWQKNQKSRIRNTFNGYHVMRGVSKNYIVKSAMISFMIPTILEIFPGAKFLHIYRSGPPVVESLVVKEWEKYGSYFENQSEFRCKCAKYWNDCIMEIERQRTGLELDKRGTFFEISYEQLCENPSAALKSLGRFLQVEPGGFVFDTSKISSRNFKAGDYEHDEAWAPALKLMSPAMKLKSYIP